MVSAAHICFCKPSVSDPWGGDALEHRLPALFQLPAALHTVPQGDDRNLVHSPGGFLPVSGDEGNGGTLIQKISDGPGFQRRNVEIPGDGGNNTGISFGHTDRLC
jgi:hypothetical protein